MYEENMIPETNEILLDWVMRKDLTSSAKWVKFTCVFFLILTILGILGLLSFALTSALQAGSFLAKGDSYILVLFYILYIYPIVKGLHFAKSMKNACFMGSQSELEKAFAALRLCIVWFTVLNIIFCVLTYGVRIFHLIA